MVSGVRGDFTECCHKLLKTRSQELLPQPGSVFTTTQGWDWQSGWWRWSHKGFIDMITIVHHPVKQQNELI